MREDVTALSPNEEAEMRRWCAEKDLGARRKIFAPAISYRRFVATLDAREAKMAEISARAEKAERERDEARELHAHMRSVLIANAPPKASPDDDYSISSCVARFNAALAAAQAEAEKAKASERERCARIAEQHGAVVSANIAAVIRAGDGLACSANGAVEARAP